MSSLAALHKHLRELDVVLEMNKDAKEGTTTEISDKKAWITEIMEQGNKPEDWIKLIEQTDKHMVFPDSLSRYHYLCELYDQAFKSMSLNQNKRNPVYAKLLIDYANLKSDLSPTEAQVLFSHARANVKKFAMVHVVSAEFEVKCGNASKGQKILEKAKLYGAEPLELLSRAMKRLAAGSWQLVSPEEKKFNGKWQSKGKITLVEDCDTTGKQKSNVMLFSSRNRTGDTCSDRLLSSTFHGNTSSGSQRFSSFAGTHTGQIGKPRRVKVSAQGLNNSSLDDDEENTVDKLKQTPKAAAASDRSSQLLYVHRTSQQETRHGRLAKSEEDKHSTSNKCVNREQSKSKLSVGDQACLTQLGTDLPNQDSSLSCYERDKHLSLSSDAMKSTRNFLCPVSLDNQKAHRKVTTQEKKTKYKCQDCLPQSASCTKCPPTETLSGQKPTKSIIVNGQPYMVLKMVGRGGTSKVYQVLDQKNNVLAVKLVDLDGVSEEIIKGYTNEITLLQRLQYSDKVIKMHDFEHNEHENCLYVVMECGNTDLATLFKKRTKKERIPEEMVKFYWAEMLRAVQALHREGIVHSDLKPANFIIVDGSLKLIDFGIADAIPQDRTSVIRGCQMGTLNYMSPEAIIDYQGESNTDNSGKACPQFKFSISVAQYLVEVYNLGKKLMAMLSLSDSYQFSQISTVLLGVKSDVWSLGCILYNMVHGKTPFQHLPNNMNKLLTIINNKVPIDFPPVADMHLSEVLRSCLRRDPKERPSIEELLLHPYLTEQKTEGHLKKLVAQITQALVTQMAQSNVSSPRTISAFSQNFLKKMESRTTIYSLLEEQQQQDKENQSSDALLMKPLMKKEVQQTPAATKQVKEQ